MLRRSFVQVLLAVIFGSRFTSNNGVTWGSTITLGKIDPEDEVYFQQEGVFLNNTGTDAHSFTLTDVNGEVISPSMFE